MKKTTVLEFLLAVGLTVASLVRLRGIWLPDYIEYHYGYPLPWLMHGVGVLVVVRSQWWLNDQGASLIVDYFFWLGVSLVVVSFISIVWIRIRRRQPREKVGSGEPIITTFSFEHSKETP